MTLPLQTVGRVLIVAALLLGGCGTRDAITDGPDHPPRPMHAQPAGEGDEPGGGTPDNPASVAPAGSVEPVAAAEPANDAGRRIAGMIGQVNGRAIYAHQVLEPLDEQLRGLAQRAPRREFQFRAAELIEERLGEIIRNALILGEARRDLSERERQALTMIMRKVRQELIRRHGRGSPAVADRNLREQTGQGLEQTLEDRRQELVLDRYRHRELFPRVNVTRRDIERYYHDNRDRYNPAATRTLRLIRAAGAAEADAVRQRLDAGEAFEDVASDDQLNAYRPDRGGLMADAPGDEVFGHAPLNEAMRELDAGEHAGPIDAGGEQWFLKVVEIDRPDQQPFRDVQLQIRQHLELRQLERLWDEHYQELVARGSYSPIEQMAATLMEIAMSRYAPPE